MRSHGCQAPPSKFQVSAVFVFSALVVCFYLFTAHILPSHVLRVAAYAIHSTLVAAVVWFHVLCSSTNPADPGVMHKLTTQHQHAHTQDLNAQHQDHPQVEMLYCSICATQVRKESKHCRACDKCVDRFDHHCRWLNNCIGRRNYPMFLGLVISTFAMLVVEVAFGVFLAAQCFADCNSINKLSFLSPSYILISVLVSSGVSALTALPLVELLCFHLLLLSKRMTTYDYIVMMRNKNEAAAKRELALEATTPRKDMEAGSTYSAPRQSLPPHGMSHHCLCSCSRATRVAALSSPSSSTSTSTSTHQQEEMRAGVKKKKIRISAWNLANLTAPTRSSCDSQPSRSSTIRQEVASMTTVNKEASGLVGQACMPTLEEEKEEEECRNSSDSNQTSTASILAPHKAHGHGTGQRLGGAKHGIAGQSGHSEGQRWASSHEILDECPFPSHSAQHNTSHSEAAPTSHFRIGKAGPISLPNATQDRVHVPNITMPQIVHRQD